MPGQFSRPQSPSLQGRNPDTPETQQQAERTEILNRVKGRGKVEGKVKNLLRQVQNIQSKVGQLGTLMVQRFDRYLESKTSTPIDISSPDGAQQSVNQWVDRLTVQNLDTLREFDRGLDLVLLRVEFRKQMATKLEAMGTSLAPEEKAQIGLSLERQLNFKEGLIDSSQPLRLNQFKGRLEVMHLMTKFADLLGVMKQRGATSLSTAITIPEHSVAYPPVRGRHGFIFFKTWTEQVNGETVMYSIDNYGSVQRFKPFQTTEFASNPYEVMYNAHTKQRHSEFPTTRYSEQEINRYKPQTSQINEQQRRQMLENLAYELTFIDSESRNFRGLPPAELRGFQAQLMSQFRNYEQRWAERYRRTPGRPGSANQPIVDTLRGFTANNGQTFRTQVRDLMSRSAVMTHGVTHNAPQGEREPRRERRERRERTERPTTPPRTPERNPDQLPGELALNSRLTYPGSNGVLPWARNSFTTAGSSDRLAHLNRPDGLRIRRVMAVFINGLPVNTNRVRLSADGTQLDMVTRALSERNITVLFEDDMGTAGKNRHRVHLDLTGTPPTLSDATRNNPEFAQFDPNSLRQGVIDYQGTGTERLAGLYPLAPGATRELLRLEINGVQKNGVLDADTDTLSLAAGNPKQRLTPPTTVRAVIRVTMGSQTREVARTITLQDYPQIPDTTRTNDVIWPQQNSEIHLGNINDEEITERRLVARLGADTGGPPVERRILDENGQPHPLFTLDGDEVILKNKGKITIAEGAPLVFRIDSRREGSNHGWREGELNTLRNEPYTPQLQEQLGDSTTLEIGNLRDTEPGLLIALPATPPGILQREIINAETNATGITINANRFTINNNKVFYRGGVDVPAAPDRTITLTFQHLDQNGQQVGAPEAVVLQLRPAPELPSSTLALEGGDSDGQGRPRKRIQLGSPKATGTNLDLGVRLANRNLPYGAELTVTRVMHGTEDRTHNGNAIIYYDGTTGRFRLREGATLPIGTLVLTVETNNNGTRANRDIVIENQALEAPSENDARLIVSRLQTGALDTASAGRPPRLNMAQLTPLRNGVTRTLTSARIGNTIYEGVKLDGNTIYLENQNRIPTGDLVLTFTINAPGHPAREIRTTLHIQAPPAAPSGTPTPPHPHQMPAIRPSEAAEVQRGAVGTALYNELATNRAAILQQLRGFRTPSTASIAVTEMTLVTIDARQGLYEVTNNGYSTTLEINAAGKIVLHAGPPVTHHQTWELDSDTPANRQKALVYAAAMNRIMALSIGDLQLNTQDKFTDAAKQQGSYFTYASDHIGVWDKGDGSSVVPTNLWSHSFGSTSQQTAFLRLLNYRMVDTIGRAGDSSHSAISGRPNNATNDVPQPTGIAVGSESYHGMPISTTRIGRNRDYQFTLGNLNREYTYSYSGNGTSWFQLPQTATDMPVSLSWNNVGNLITHNSKTYAVVTVAARPRDAANTRRPSVRQYLVEVVPPFDPATPTADSFQLNSFDTTRHENLTYRLQQRINSPDGKGFESGDQLSYETSGFYTEGGEKDVIIKKGGTAFARVDINPSTGESTIIILSEANRQQYEASIVNNRSNRTIRIRKK